MSPARVGCDLDHTLVYEKSVPLRDPNLVSQPSRTASCANRKRLLMKGRYEAGNSSRKGDAIMNDATRRTFLVAAGAGAAAVGVAAVVPAAASAATTHGSVTPSGEPLVAYISDASTGELTVMVGEREVQIKNPSLVSQLHAAVN